MSVGLEICEFVYNITCNMNISTYSEFVYNINMNISAYSELVYNINMKISTYSEFCSLFHHLEANQWNSNIKRVKKADLLVSDWSVIWHSTDIRAVCTPSTSYWRKTNSTCQVINVNVSTNQRHLSFWCAGFWNITAVWCISVV